MDEQQGMMQPAYGSQNTTGNTTYGRGLEASAIKYRLDNEPMLRDVELYLRSAKVVGEQRGDEYIESIQVIGKPKANEEGVQSIMGYLRMTVGAHNVQGNMTWDRYDVLIYEIHTDLAQVIMANLHTWGIRADDYDMIVNSIMHTIQLFLSRTVDNQERLSYGQSMMTKEMSVVNGPEKKGFFKTLFGG